MAQGNSITSQSVMTPVFRVAFPNVFEPNEDGKYGLAMLFDKQTFNAAFLEEILKEVIAEVQTKIYNGQPLPPHFNKNPLKDGDVPNSTGKVHNGFEGNFVLNAGTKFQPGVVQPFADPATGKPMILSEPREFYAGCYARAKVHAYYYNFKGKVGISLSVGNIQKIKDGESLGGGRAATEDFDAYDEPQQADYSGMPQQAQPAQPAQAVPNHAAPQQYAQPTQPMQAPPVGTQAAAPATTNIMNL